MSLDWELGRIKNWQEVCQITAEQDDRVYGIKAGDKLLNPVTKALIWATLAVGMRGITEENHKEFFARLRLVEMAGDCYLWRDGTKSLNSPANYITLAEVKAHIGLGTNVTQVTQAKWAKGLFDKVAEDGARDERQRAAKAEMEARIKPIPQIDA